MKYKITLLLIVIFSLSACAPMIPLRKPEVQEASGAIPGPPPGFTPYILGPSDQLTIRIWNQDGTERSVYVDPNGGVDYPLVGYVNISGLSVPQVQEKFKEALGKYFVNPVVEVRATSFGSKKYFILGEVTTPGAKTLDHQTTVWEAVASASGFTSDAEKDYVLLCRDDGKEIKVGVVNLNVSRFTQAANSKSVYLQNGDIVIAVPLLMASMETFFSRLNNILSGITSVARTAVVFKQMGQILGNSSSTSTSTQISY